MWLYRSFLFSGMGREGEAKDLFLAHRTAVLRQFLFSFLVFIKELNYSRAGLHCKHSDPRVLPHLWYRTRVFATDFVYDQFFYFPINSSFGNIR